MQTDFKRVFPSPGFLEHEPKTKLGLRLLCVKVAKLNPSSIRNGYKPKTSCQLPSSLKEFFSVKHFSNKLKKFLQVADIDSIFSVLLWPCLFALYYIGLIVWFAICEKICLSMSVCLSVCLSFLLPICNLYYLLFFVFIWATSSHERFAFLVACHCDCFVRIHFYVVAEMAK